MTALNLKDEKLAKSIKCRLEQLCCPYTENVEESWILDLVFNPGESRICLLQWLFSKLDSKLNDIIDPQHAPLDTKMDSRIQNGHMVSMGANSSHLGAAEKNKSIISTIGGQPLCVTPLGLLFVASTLGLCHSDDADLIRGVKTGSRQVSFINNLLDLVCVVDAAETSASVLGSSSNRGNLEDQFIADCNLADLLSTQTNIDGMFPSDIRILPPDITRQIELDTQQTKPISDTDRNQSVPDLNKLTDEVNKLSRDLDRQTEMLNEIVRKHKCSDGDSGSISQSTLKQTLRLTLSELDQLITSFVYCYDNEMRPWCGSASASQRASNGTLGPTLKRINAPLDQFVHLLSDVQSIRLCYRKLCTELHKEVGQLRRDVEHLAQSRLHWADDGNQLLFSSLSQAVDILEQSIVRIESSSSNTLMTSSSVMSSSASQHLRQLPHQQQFIPQSSLNASVASATLKLLH